MIARDPLNHENTKARRHEEDQEMKRPVFDPQRIRGANHQQIPSETEALATQVVDAAFTVHQALKPSFPESVYERAMSIELASRGIPHQTQSLVNVFYRNHCVGEGRIDILVADQLVVELKTVEKLMDVHVAQVLGYLQSKRLPLGLLINFHAGNMRDGIRRVIL